MAHQGGSSGGTHPSQGGQPQHMHAQGHPTSSTHSPEFLTQPAQSAPHMTAMMGPQNIFVNPHMHPQGHDQHLFQQQQQQQQQHMHPGQQQRPPSGGGMRPPQQPMPAPFHHPAMAPGIPFGPSTPGHVNLGAGGYFGGAPVMQQQPGPMQQQQQHQQQRMGHPPAISQHAMMMPPPPGAMPPMPKGAHPANMVVGMNVGAGMEPLGRGGAYAGQPLEAGSSSSSSSTALQPAASNSIALPPLPSKGASDFVKKLFNMLDDELYEPIVSWGPTGDSFVVKNMNDFTKHVLPRHFRHSNFASFVRQLNKYDFHKVKNANSDDMDPMAGLSASGDQIWEFKHPDFVRAREDLLENVKRKAPTTKKGKGPDDRDGSPPLADNPTEMAVKAAEGYTELKGQVDTLTAVQEQMNRHINGLTKQYQGIIGEMLTFQRNMVQQDQLMQNLIQYLMNMENERAKDGGQAKLEDGGSGSRQLLNAAGPFVAPQDARQLIGSYSEVARASFSQMSEITKRIQNAQQSLRSEPAPIPPRASIQDVDPSSSSTRTGTTGDSAGQTGRMSPKSTQGTSPENTFTPGGTIAAGAENSITQRRLGFSTGSSGSPQPTMYLHPPHFNDDGAGDFFNPAAAFGAGSLANMEAAGLRVFTVGTLQPREEHPAEDYLNLNTPASQAGGENGQHQQQAQPPQQSSTSTPRGSPDANGGSGGDGMKLMVPNLEELPEGMPRLDRRTSLFPGAPGDKSPSPLAHAGMGAGSGGSSPQQSGDANIPLIPHSPGSANGNGSSILRVRRSTYVPGWAVPPRVLLVDDDAVCRKLSSKFLQVFGCAIDVAVDGVNAVNKMNLEKYDLVLMDIVMPNLDGVSATSLIRQFDPRTPIISMTSNSQPNELLTYMQNGMTDVLPKPFTKEGLLNMLEKHLIHLKTVTQMEQIPRQLGFPPLPEGALQTMISSAAGLAPGLAGAVPALAGPSSAGGHQLQVTSAKAGGDEEGDDGGSMNPLASLGFSDAEYISMLQNFIASGSVTDSGQGEITSSLAQAVGASLGEGQGGARRPSQAVLPSLGHHDVSSSSIPARKRRSDKMDPTPGSIAEEGPSTSSAAVSSSSSATSATGLVGKSPTTGGGARKRQRTAGSG